MGRIGRLISSKINTYILNVVEARFKYNVSANSYGPSGDDSPGLPEDRFALVEIDGAGNWVAVGVLVKSQGADSGEKILYSRDSAGVVKATVKLLKDGIIEINGNADFAVRFNALETGFNTLRSDHNTFLTHVHGASGTPPVPPAVPSTASISAAKVDEVKII